MPTNTTAWSARWIRPTPSRRLQESLVRAATRGDSGKGTAAQLYYPAGRGSRQLWELCTSATITTAWCARWFWRPTSLRPTPATTPAVTAGITGRPRAPRCNVVSGVAADSTGNLFIADSDNCVIREVTKVQREDQHRCRKPHLRIHGRRRPGHQRGDEPSVRIGGQRRGTCDLRRLLQPAHPAIHGGWKHQYRRRQRHGVRRHLRRRRIGHQRRTLRPDRRGDKQCGTVYIGNNNNYVVDKFTVGGNLNRVAGNHSYNLETLITGAPANGVELKYPFGIADDSSGNIYIADSHNYMVREVCEVHRTGEFLCRKRNLRLSRRWRACDQRRTDLQLRRGQKTVGGNVYIADTNNCLVRKVIRQERSALSPAWW